MSPWATLGIDPTGDTRIIRRAYAARLKALDPGDRAGFIALRAALDAANSWWWEDDDEEWLDAPEAVAPMETLTETPLPIRIVPPPEPTPPEPTWRDEAEAIEALVWADRPTDPDERRARNMALNARAEAMLGAIDGVADGQEAERWLADLIVDTMPRGDGLIGAGVRRFDWERQVRQWDCDWAVKRAMQRRADVAWLRGQPRFSTIGQGWEVLSDPVRYPPRANEEGVVGVALREIDARHPTLRTDLDESAVIAWQEFIARRHDRPYARFDRRVSAAMSRVGHVLQWPIRRVHPNSPVTPFRVIWALFIIVQVARCCAAL